MLEIVERVGVLIKLERLARHRLVQLLETSRAHLVHEGSDRLDPRLGVLLDVEQQRADPNLDEVDRHLGLHFVRGRDHLRVALQPAVEHDARGLLLLKLGEVLHLVRLPQLIVLAVRVELLVDASKGLLDLARHTRHVVLHVVVRDDVRVVGEDDWVLLVRDVLGRSLDAAAVQPSNKRTRGVDK